MDERRPESLAWKVIKVVTMLFAWWSLVALLLTPWFFFAPVVACVMWLFQKVKRGTIKAKWKLALFLSVISVTLTSWGWTVNIRRPNVFLLQSGYTGWVRVRWSIPGAAPLPLKDGHWVLSIPANGLLNTSTAAQDGWGSDTFFYVDKQGQRIRVPYDDRNSKEVIVSGPIGGGQEDSYFIGTKDQLKHAPQDKNGRKRKAAS